MEITVNKNKKLKTIQEEFQKCFPFLKLEFYSNSQRSGEGSVKKNTLSTDRTIGEILKFNKDSILHIKRSMKVSELEKAFLEVFGLNVQVFRKSNNLWLQTTITDNWTLEKQNKNGMEMNISEKSTPQEDDFREQK